MNRLELGQIIYLFVLIILMIPTIIALLDGAPWVPTPMNRVRKMLALGGVKKGSKVYDVGCGDGRAPYIASNEMGANAVGIELSPLIYILARIRKFFWRSKAEIQFGSLWNKNLGDADVVVFYLMPGFVERVAKKLEKELKPGARVISYAFQIKCWKEIHRERRVRKKGYSPIWVYEIGETV